MSLSFLEFGVGGATPLVILHGLLGSSRNWQTLAARWADQGRRVLVFDMPNHGSSPWTEVMDYPFMARSLWTMIRQEVGEKVALLGHSMGGKAAMVMALTAPDMTERLIVADAAPVAYEHTFAPYFRAMKAVSLGRATSRAAVEAVLAEYIDDARVRAFLLQNLAGEPGHYRWRANLAVLHAAMSDILGFPTLPPGLHYDGPTLFIHGGLSDYVRPDEQEDMIRGRFPRAHFHELEQAGHWLHADQPEAFVAAVSAFLNG